MTHKERAQADEERQRAENEPLHRSAERAHRHAAALHERAAALFDAHDDPEVPESEAVQIADQVIRGAVPKLRDAFVDKRDADTSHIRRDDARVATGCGAAGSSPSRPGVS